MSLQVMEGSLIKLHFSGFFIYYYIFVTYKFIKLLQIMCSNRRVRICVGSFSASYIIRSFTGKSFKQMTCFELFSYLFNMFENSLIWSTRNVTIYVENILLVLKSAYSISPMCLMLFNIVLELIYKCHQKTCRMDLFKDLKYNPSFLWTPLDWLLWCSHFGY